MRERQDVSVALVEPASTTATHALARLPGVILAEAERSASVRLVHGHRDERTTITGLPAGSQLRLLRDERLAVVALPPSGLVLNERLARRLGVVRGDVVRVEVLQGTLPCATSRWWTW